MTDKIIDEVMELVENYGSFCFDGGVGHGDREDVDLAKDAIRAKLREVLERKTIKPIHPPGLTSFNAKLSFDNGWRHAERAHNIGAE